MVLVLCLAAVALGAGLAVTAGGAAVVARHRADAAADLAALAAAGPVVPDCARAEEVAAGNGARLTSCVLLPDGTVTVEVAVPLPGWLAGLAGGRRPVGRARAGHLPPG